MNRTGVLLKKYAGCGIVFGMLTIVLLQLTGTDAAAQARGTDSSHFTCGGWNVVSSAGSDHGLCPERVGGRLLPG